MRLRQVVPNLILAKVCRCDTIRFQNVICQLPPPSLSDIFTVRCFPIMSSSRALQETFQSLELPVCIGVLQVFTNVNEPLSADDENFINFFISQVESVIINLEREKSRCQIKMLQDGIDKKVKAIDNLKSIT